MSATRPLVTAPAVIPVAEVAVGDTEVSVGQARYDQAHYDVYPEATYSGTDALFNDVACTVIEAATYTGRERANERFDIGTATLLVNNDAGFWDYPAADADTSVLTVRPGRAVRIGVDLAAERVWLWRGWIDATRPEYRPGVGDVVTVDCVDAKGEAGRTEIPALVTPVGDGEATGQRLNRICDNIGWPTSRRQFDPSAIRLRATSLGDRAVSLLDVAAESSGGAVFGDDNGFLVYRHRDWLSWPTGSQPDVRIGNRPGDQACPVSWEISFARADFASRIVYGRAGEDARTLNDTTSQARFGVETFTNTSLETFDSQEVDNIGARLYRVRSFDRAPRIAAVTLDAAHAGSAAVMAKVSPYLPSLVFAGLVEDDGRSVFSRWLYVTGVSHTITADQWTTRIALDDAYPFLQSSNARYDTARYNQDYYARVV